MPKNTLSKNTLRILALLVPPYTFLKRFFVELISPINILTELNIWPSAQCIEMRFTSWYLSPYQIVIGLIDWLIDDALFVCLLDGLILGFYYSGFNTGKYWIWNHIDYHPCHTSKTTISNVFPQHMSITKWELSLNCVAQFTKICSVFVSIKIHSSINFLLWYNCYHYYLNWRFLLQLLLLLSVFLFYNFHFHFELNWFLW